MNISASTLVHTLPIADDKNADLNTFEPLCNANSPEHQRRRVFMHDLWSLFLPLQFQLLRGHPRLWAARAAAAAMALAAPMVCLSP